MGGFGPRIQTVTRPGTGLGLGTNTEEGRWADVETGEGQD